MDWIKCSDKLPDEHKHVLGYSASHNFYYVVFLSVYKNEWQEGYKGKRFEIEDITHWMPLPELPTE